MLQKLDLLSIERDDPNPRLVDATLDQGLGELAHKLCLYRVLHEIADSRVACWKGVSVNEDGFATTKERKTKRLNDCGKKNNLNDLPLIREPL